MRRDRVVVTGLGVICPVGNDPQAAWHNLCHGKSGVRSIEPDRFDSTSLSCRFAAQVSDFDPAEWIEEGKDLKKMDDFISYAIAAAAQAVKDSKLDTSITPSHRRGVAIGSGIGGIGFIENAAHIQANKGSKRLSPFFIPGSIINMAAGHVSMVHDCQGPNLALATACTTGTHMIGLAGRLIESGDADVMICGGSEAPITKLCMGGFCSARALSSRNDMPAKASRPWDKDRDGFVMGEGAGVLVLESLEHATARKAKIYAELAGFGMSGDAYHITLPEETGKGALLAMQNALRNANLKPHEIDYINAHGTSTLAGDKIEVAAIKQLFGEHPPSLLVSSTKSMTGHLLGAAGAIEAAFSVQSIINQQAPPTINLENPDEGCDLDFVANTPRSATINHALSNSFGFGGTNGCLIFSKYC